MAPMVPAHNDKGSALKIIGLDLCLLSKVTVHVDGLFRRFESQEENALKAIKHLAVSAAETLTECQKILEKMSVSQISRLREILDKFLPKISALTKSMFQGLRKVGTRYYIAFRLPLKVYTYRNAWFGRQLGKWCCLGRRNSDHKMLDNVEKISRELEGTVADFQSHLVDDCYEVDSRSRTGKLDGIRLAQPGKFQETQQPSMVKNPDNIVLNFESIDTVEGELKAKVLEARDFGVIAASGAKVHGFEGLGGVGKTVAMIGLASQPDIQARFRNGIYFMSFGQEATTEKVIEQITKIVEDSGGAKHAKEVTCAQSAAEAARIAATWFSGKVCLFLCDDLWPTASDIGFFPDLKILVSCDPRSRMVVTTRDATIAHETGSVVRFGTRDPTGSVSKEIFFQYAGLRDKSGDKEFEEALDELLRLCGGLPLLLAVVGRKLADEDAAAEVKVRLRNQVMELKSESRRLELLQRPILRNYPVCLVAAFLLSLKFLDKKLSHRRAIQTSPYSVEEMFHSFSILSNQGWIPISVLSRLWETDATVYVTHFNQLRLVLLESRKLKAHRQKAEREETGIVLHDLALDICRMEASQGSLSWHEILLDSYWKAGQRVRRGKAFVSNVRDVFLDIREQHRPWWSSAIPEDGYIHYNLSRHLVAAGRHKELWSLLLNPEWSKLWIHFRNLPGLQRDISSLLEAVRFDSSEDDQNNLVQLKLIYRALRCAWGRVEQLPREYPYQMLGRLYDARPSLDVVSFFLKQVEASAERPFLKPLHQCFEDPRNGPEMEIHLQDICSSVDFFPSGNHVAAAVGFEILVIDVRYGTILKRCIGHERLIRNVAVTSDDTWIVSADDLYIRVWEKRTGFQKGKVFDCDNSLSALHCNLVIRENINEPQIFATVMQMAKAWGLYSGMEFFYQVADAMDFIAFSADGQELIYASSESKTVGILNMTAMTQSRESLKCPPNHGDIACLAVSGDGKSIACGTRKGEVIFWDRYAKEPRAEDLYDHRGVVLALAMRKDAKVLVSGSDLGDVRVWDLENRSRPGSLLGRHASRVMSLALSPDGTRLVSGSHDNTIRVWDLTNIVSVYDGLQNLQHHAGPVTCIASSPDGSFIVSGSEDKTVRVWDARKAKLIGHPLPGQGHRVNHVAVSRDSDVIYSLAGPRAWCWKVETLERCPLSMFVKSRETSNENHTLSLVQRQDNIVECFYKSGEGKEYLLAQMPVQARKLLWHIDQERETVYVGRETGAIMHLKVAS